MNQFNKIVFLVSFQILCACGGSGGNTSPVIIPPSPVPPNIDIQPKRTVNGLSFYHQDSFSLGQPASFAVTAANSDLVDISWRQTAGAELEILASHSQVIAFDIKQSGDYQLEFTGTTSAGQTINETFNFTALTSSDSSANIRLDHAVSETASVSLRVASNPNKSVLNISWNQLDGSQIVNIDTQENDIFFDAPQVTQDEIIQIEARINYTDGSSDSDTSLLVVKNIEINPNGYFPRYAENIVSTDVFAYVKDGPYADILPQCVYDNLVEDSCQFSELPLIGQEHSAPTIEQVLERLVVSHAWMGQRFKQFLEESQTSQDMLKLLRATTAIIISYDVRPSFYWTATGAIYLDAANFWVTPEERDTLNTQPDYRSDFGKELQFFIPWRYVKDNDYYFRNSDYPTERRLTKTFRDMEANITWLMYHELAHANDFFPPNSWQTLPLQTSPLIYSNQNDASSVAFDQTHGVNSATMKSLAQVSFAGETATTTQKSLSAEDIVGHFEPDLAPAYYSYSTIREDYATLFERFMMSYRLGVSADVAIISEIDNDDLIVTWGQRDRFNAEKIQIRVQSVVQDILPELDVANIQQTLPSPLLMRTNQDWFSNIELGSPSPQSKTLQRKKTIKEMPREDYWHTYRHGPKSP
ncbi:hypothetical protein [Paraglaciecola sp.]|uniref:hypothetical protein n=1 Tax=Paraglaciecola sp. TaxID=1920173 RepID=UPI003EFACF64